MDVEKTMQFILEQQAKFELQIGQLIESQYNTEQNIIRLYKTGEETDRRLDQITAHLDQVTTHLENIASRHEELASRQADGESRLNALITLFERHISHHP